MTLRTGATLGVCIGSTGALVGAAAQNTNTLLAAIACILIAIYTLIYVQEDERR